MPKEKAQLIKTILSRSSSIKSFAEQCKINYSSLRSVLCGLYNPKDAVARKILDNLGFCHVCGSILTIPEGAIKELENDHGDSED